MNLTKRQREILDFIQNFMATRGYSPSLEEIAEHFGLASVATVHKHLTALEERGAIERGHNQSRSIRLVERGVSASSLTVPLLGRVAAGAPIEAIEDTEDLMIPEDMLGRRRTYALQVQGDSMVDEGIHDGDYVVIEEREVAETGETVIALLPGGEVTLKRYYREGRIIRLQPANEQVKPIMVPERDVRIQGVVIGVIRKYGRKVG
ncbi:MAG: transcriptional repressor LexA [bacterium]